MSNIFSESPENTSEYTSVDFDYAYLANEVDAKKIKALINNLLEGIKEEGTKLGRLTQRPQDSHYLCVGILLGAINQLQEVSQNWVTSGLSKAATDIDQFLKINE